MHGERCGINNTYMYTHTHTHTHTEYYSTIKKNKMLPFATTCMNLEGIMLSEIGQTEKDKYIVISYMWNLKNKTNEYNKTETDSQIQRTN